MGSGSRESGGGKRSSGGTGVNTGEDLLFGVERVCPSASLALDTYDNSASLNVYPVVISLLSKIRDGKNHGALV